MKIALTRNIVKPVQHHPVPVFKIPEQVTDRVKTVHREVAEPKQKAKLFTSVKTVDGKRISNKLLKKESLTEGDPWFYQEYVLRKSAAFFHKTQETDFFAREASLKTSVDYVQTMLQEEYSDTILFTTDEIGWDVVELLMQNTGELKSVKEAESKLHLPAQYNAYEQSLRDTVAVILLWLHQENVLQKTLAQYEQSCAIPADLSKEQVRELITMMLQTDMVTAWYDGLEQAAADDFPFVWKETLLQDYVVAEMAAPARMQAIMESILASHMQHVSTA